MPYLYYFLLLFTSFLWGGNFVVGKTLVDHASPVTLTTLRWLIAVLCLIPIVWWKEKSLSVSRKAILPLLLMGITGVVLFNLFQFLALDFTSATNVGLISTLNMFSIALFSFLFLKEKINTWQLGSMLISFIGVLLVLSKGHFEMLFSIGFNKGDLLMVAAVCVWGLYSIVSKWAMKYTTPLMATLYSGVFGVIVLIPLNVHGFTITNLNASFVQSILYTGVVSTVLCMLLWNIGVQKIGATSSGMFLNFNPIFTAFIAFMWLGERLTLIQGVGSVTVIVGCFLFTFFKQKLNALPTLPQLYIDEDLPSSIARK